MRNLIRYTIILIPYLSSFVCGIILALAYIDMDDFVSKKALINVPTNFTAQAFNYNGRYIEDSKGNKDFIPRKDVIEWVDKVNKLLR